MVKFLPSRLKMPRAFLFTNRRYKAIEYESTTESSPERDVCTASERSTQTGATAPITTSPSAPPCAAKISNNQTHQILPGPPPRLVLAPPDPTPPNNNNNNNFPIDCCLTGLSRLEQLAEITLAAAGGMTGRLPPSQDLQGMRFTPSPSVSEDRGCCTDEELEGMELWTPFVVSGSGEEDEQHVCPECGKRYSTSSNLARHRQTHRSVGDKKARKCPHCEKVYVSMPAYSMHVRTHNQGCQCPYCGKCFSRPWLLQGHIRTHTGEKPFKCPVCQKAFADKSNLRAHIQTHSNTKPYVCGRCGKAFALKSYLYKHEESSCMRMHNHNPRPSDDGITTLDKSDE